MPDKFSQETRSKIMKSIRSKTKMEDKICKALWKQGLRFRRNVKDLPGKPDIAIKRYQTVVFLDSCFWHVCDIHGHIPKSNLDYWVNKLKKNKERDKKVTDDYIFNKWRVLRIWEHQVKEDFEGTVKQIAAFLIQSKETAKRTK
ncbi:very short patch repair endonuclease [Paenibacillus allorhizosphaerae]|uniref:Very short patch repair endonuclease n=1 Tax=Paenibacillus allorhizosphaerae TaxID=2849866 RepID=A0ABN7U0U4_9BACL|nr:very short patch repair endonuclease [Paenibacillus allorhizosphaerae]CAG7658413.1 Very short patch repair protein [Paenibacillus allorhizosphaerae]